MIINIEWLVRFLRRVEYKIDSIIERLAAPHTDGEIKIVHKFLLWPRYYNYKIYWLCNAELTYRYYDGYIDVYWQLKRVVTAMERKEKELRINGE